MTIEINICVHILSIRTDTDAFLKHFMIFNHGGVQVGLHAYGSQTKEMPVWFACVYVCTACVSGALGSQKRAAEHLIPWN